MRGAILMGGSWLLMVAGVALATPAVGQVDTFSGGSVDGWTNGALATDPVNISTGGPAGVGDSFLQAISGTGGGPRMLIYNRESEWTGDYIAAGITRIDMDLKNLGDTDLNIRIALRATTGGQFDPGYVSTNAFSLPVGSGWQHASFLISSSDLTALNSPTALETFLTSVADFRILSSDSPALIGDALTGALGIDNIQAIPEPAAGLLLGLFTPALLRRRRK